MSSRLCIVCNDSATLAMLLTRQLEKLDYCVQQVEPAQLLQVLSPNPALICVELHGLAVNGFKLLRQLRRLYRGPVILFSASGRISDLAWGRLAGASSVLMRPFTDRQLAQCIDTLESA